MWRDRTTIESSHGRSTTASGRSRSPIATFLNCCDAMYGRSSASLKDAVDRGIIEQRVLTRDRSRLRITPERWPSRPDYGADWRLHRRLKREKSVEDQPLAPR